MTEMLYIDFNGEVKRLVSETAKYVLQGIKKKNKYIVLSYFEGEVEMYLVVTDILINSETVEEILKVHPNQELIVKEINSVDKQDIIRFLKL